MKIVYSICYALWWLFSLLPFQILYLLSDGLYLLAAHVVKYRHKVIWKNLSESFPEKNEMELRAIEKQFYRQFCDYIVETIKLMTISKAEFRRRMVYTGIDEINQLLKKGQSVGVYLGHVFNWEWMTSLPLWITENSQCCELYHPLENKAMDQLFKTVREKQNALCIPMQESLRKIMQFNHKGHPVVVGYIADQVPLWWNIHHWLDFLHHDTPVLTGTERIMRHTNQAVFYGDMRRVKRGYYQCDMLLMTTEPKKTKEWKITDWYFKMLEESIRREPANWLWSHNRWKRTHEDFDRNWIEKEGKVVRREPNEISENLKTELGK